MYLPLDHHGLTPPTPEEQRRNQMLGEVREAVRAQSLERRRARRRRLLALVIRLDGGGPAPGTSAPLSAAAHRTGPTDLFSRASTGRARMRSFRLRQRPVSTAAR